MKSKVLSIGMLVISGICFNSDLVFAQEEMQMQKQKEQIYQTGLGKFVLIDHSSSENKKQPDNVYQMSTVKAKDGGTVSSITFNKKSEQKNAQTSSHPMPLDIEVSIYPNPFNGNATVEISNGQMSNCSFVVYNLLGDEVQRVKITSQKFTIDRNGLPNGMYFYKINNEANSALKTGKLVIGQ